MCVKIKDIKVDVKFIILSEFFLVYRPSDMFDIRARKSERTDDKRTKSVIMFPHF